MKYLLSFFFLVSLLFAAPAYPGKRTFIQPNGESITYHLQGDEHLHWMETNEGEIILYSKKNKRMESALIKNTELIPSGQAISHNKRSRKSASLQHSISQKDLEALYKYKREEHSNRMRKSQMHH